ncbi:unnamed protein product [Phytophthora lilii]|uniref:Unnamed protein product n=1 Tax=Phytophthora lilii TaxID=2077276 RepID=A0A9W6WSX2_9STRA|nr:unnamed protein product [Phytophthora lilii]
MSSPTPQGSRTPSEASAAIGGSPTSAEASAGGVAPSAGLPAPAGSCQSYAGLSMPASAAADARGASSGSAGAPAGASEDSRPSASSRSTSTSASASASGASSSLPAPVGRANESSVPSAATSSSPTSASRPVPALPPMHAIIPMPLPRYIRLEELSSVVNEASETTVREGTRAVADNLDVSFESLARLMVHLAREPPLRFNPDLDERLKRAEGLQAAVNAVVPLADAPPGRDEELAALVDECEDLRFRLADAEAALAREVADRQRVEYLCTQASGERNAAQDELRRVRGELLAANRELGLIRSDLDNSTQMVANLRVQLQDKDRALNAVHLQHRVDRSDFRAAVAKYSAEVAQLSRLLQSSATPVSPSTQPVGASYGSQRSPSSRPTNPGKRPLSKSLAAGLSLAAAGLGGLDPASVSHASLALTQQSSAPSGAATPSPPGPRPASPAAPEVVDLSGDDQVDEAPTSVDTNHEILLSTPKRRDDRPTREASVTASLRSKASLEELLASDDLVLGPQSPSDDADGPPSSPSGAASQVPVVSSSGALTSQASVVVFVGVFYGPGLCGSVIATIAASCIRPSTDRCLDRCSYWKSGIGLCFFGTPAAWSIAAVPDHGHALDHAGHQPERVYACDIASATSGVESFDAAANLGSTTPGSVADEREDPVLGGAYPNYEDPNHPSQQLRRKMPDRPPIEHWLDAFAQEVGEDSAEFQAILAAWIEFDRARNLRADRYRQQVPHRYWDWAIRPSSDPAHSTPELMLEPTILTFSFEVIPWIPKTADWVSKVSVVDDRQPWRNCWIDVPGQHPFNTTFAPCNPPVPLFAPRGFTRQQVIDDIMLNPQLSAQKIISPWAVELLNRRTQPGTPPPASPAAPVDDESKGDSPQSSVAAAAAGCCVVYW